MASDPSNYVFDSAAECDRLEAQAALQGMENLLRHFQIPPGARFLDAGCGAGTMARLVAARHPRAEVVGIDLNPGYIAYAKSRAAAEKLTNVSFEVGDVRALRDADASFDVVWSQFVLYFLPNPEAAIQEFRRVIKPGGMVVVALHDRTMLTNFPEDPRIQKRLEQVLYGVADVELARKLPVMFRACGFDAISVEIETDHIYTIIGQADPAHRRNVADILGSGLPRIAEILGSPDAATSFLADWLAYLDRPDTCTYTTLWVVKAIAAAS
jgi:ubiquinone/menaquinone biosynthesis C-methylase UbiE